MYLLLIKLFTPRWPFASAFRPVRWSGRGQRLSHVGQSASSVDRSASQGAKVEAQAEPAPRQLYI